MQEKLVSVIMPAYNAEKYIEKAIASIVGQEYKNWELVIVNDGSTDRTVEIIEKYVSKYPQQIFLYHNEKNSGAAVALNNAMHHATGEYLCWLSADDMYFETMISTQVDFLEKHEEYDAVFSKCVYIDKDDKLIGGWEPEDYIGRLKMPDSKEPYYALLIIGNAFNGCSILAKRSMFVETGNFDPEALYATDYDYWLRFAAVARIGYYDDFNVMSRRHSEQGSCIGENEIYAAKAFENMTRKKELMERLCKKAGYAYTRETIVQAYLSRMINAQGKEKELLVLTRALEAYLTEKGTV